MPNKAVVNVETGLVENIIIVDGPFDPGPGKTLMDTAGAEIGGTWDGEQYQPAPPRIHRFEDRALAVEATTTLPQLKALLLPDRFPEELATLKDEFPLFREVADALLTVSSRRNIDRAPGEREIGVYTVYQAKGLQADHVFLLGAFTQAFVKENPADGIRSLYVAVTRARSSLTVTMGRFVRGKNNPLARHLGANVVELSPHITEAASRVGVQVTHG